MHFQIRNLADLTPGLSAGSSLMVGQKINVPLNEVEAEPKADEKVTSRVDAAKSEPAYKTESYRVQRGDTLYSIAGQSKISVSELTELNRLSAAKGLQAGQVLKVPAGATVPDTYTVQSGDTLTSLSAKYNLSMDDIAGLNSINRNAGLRVGQKLKLTGEVPGTECEN